MSHSKEVGVELNSECLGVAFDLWNPFLMIDEVNLG